jgi:two-component system cell cycle response regulator
MIANDKPDRPAPAVDDGGEHHRSEHRKRTLKEAKIILTDWTVMDCVIRDISEKGARLVLGDAITLPPEFRLHIVSSNTIVPVHVLWQRGTAAGVGFTGPEEPAPTRKI